MKVSQYMASGNTFCGTLVEFPGIGIDKFGSECQIYLLTHHHADHTVGLANKSFCRRVYCSQMTKDLISQSQQFEDSLRYLVPKQYNEPFVLTVSDEEVTITLIPSYHCPGSTMFLIENRRASVLFTGDIRAETWWVNSLAKSPFLFPYTIGAKVLDQLYIDTTFSYRGEPYVEIPENNEGIKVIIEMLKNFPINDPEIQFCFMDSTSGFEEAWVQIISSIEGSLSLSADLRRRIELIASEGTYNYGNACRKLLGKVCNGPIFHVLSKPDDAYEVKNCKILVKIYQCINFNIVDFLGTSMPIPLSSVDRSLFKSIETTKMGNKLCMYGNRKWILPKDGKELLPLDLRLIFSRHSSYTETLQFTSLFRPKSVFPCTESKQTWLGGFSCERIFGQLCQNPEGEHPYDIRMFKRYGRPVLSAEAGVPTINRWNLNECNQEFRFVERYLNNTTLRKPKPEFPFFGQHQRDTFIDKGTEARDLYVTKCKDFKLESLIAGRGEAKYREIISRHQDMYLQKYLYDNGPPDNYERDEDSHTTEFSQEVRSEISLTGSEIGNKKNSIAISSQETRTEPFKRSASFASLRRSSIVMVESKTLRRFHSDLSENGRNSAIVSIEVSFSKELDFLVDSPKRRKTKASPIFNTERINDLSQRLEQDRSLWLELELSSSQNPTCCPRMSCDT
ncbi:hypothetical protein G9P44_002571 [Scheffersomyces stipitis]|nr:hypothetical protein G9P44_002571 [Scheffersomyces stipitis]